MSVLNKDKPVSGMGNFFASYFVFYYYVRRLDFVSILAFRFYSKLFKKYLVLGDFLLLFSCAYVIIIFFFKNVPIHGTVIVKNE